MCRASRSGTCSEPSCLERRSTRPTGAGRRQSAREYLLDACLPCLLQNTAHGSACDVNRRALIRPRQALPAVFGRAVWLRVAPESVTSATKRAAGTGRPPGITIPQMLRSAKCRQRQTDKGKWTTATARPVDCQPRRNARGDHIPAAAVMSRASRRPRNPAPASPASLVSARPSPYPSPSPPDTRAPGYPRPRSPRPAGLFPAAASRPCGPAV